MEAILIALEEKENSLFILFYFIFPNKKVLEKKLKLIKDNLFNN